MCTRKRFTDPIAVRLDRARDHLAESRDQLDRDAGPIALWHIMKAMLNLKRVEDRIDGSLRNPD